MCSRYNIICVNNGWHTICWSIELNLRDDIALCNARLLVVHVLCLKIAKNNNSIIHADQSAVVLQKI